MDILYSTLVMQEEWASLAWILVFFVVLCALYTIFSEKWTIKRVVSLFIAVVFSIGVVMCLTVPEKKVQQKVTISNIDHFDFEHWKIISSEGKIFTIREK